ncbi:MAG: zinc ABC transporter substrate-binding protein [Bacteroidales bacterium]|nr:zinc ABC transporter substrate-binding protein [Bacteroidales bacterium]
MKKFIIPLFLIIIAAGCGRQADGPSQDEKAVITVSIEPFRFFVEAIAGDNYRVNVIVPPGASPATYEPPPAVIRDLKDSELMIINAYLGFELAWLDKMTNVNPEAEVLELAASQDLIAADSHSHDGISHHTGVDPHFWVSPVRARIIAEDIRDFLSEKDPERKDEYWLKHLQLDSVIMDTDAYIKTLLDNATNKSFMIFHPSLSYLAMDYGLEQIAVETEGKEPSPSDLKRLIDKGREKNIKAILVQREFDKRNADLIADEIAAETIIIDPLAYDWVSSVRTIAESIAGTYK